MSTQNIKIQFNQVHQGEKGYATRRPVATLTLQQVHNMPLETVRSIAVEAGTTLKGMARKMHKEMRGIDEAVITFRDVIQL